MRLRPILKNGRNFSSTSDCTSQGAPAPSIAASAATIFAHIGQYLLRGSPKVSGFLQRLHGLVFPFFPSDVRTLFLTDGISATFCLLVLFFLAAFFSLTSLAAFWSGSSSLSSSAYFLRRSSSSSWCGLSTGSAGFPGTAAGCGGVGSVFSCSCCASCCFFWRASSREMGF